MTGEQLDADCVSGPILGELGLEYSDIYHIMLHLTTMNIMWNSVEHC